MSAVGESGRRIPGASVGQPTEACLAWIAPGQVLGRLRDLIHTELPPDPVESRNVRSDTGLTGWGNTKAYVCPQTTSTAIDLSQVSNFAQTLLSERV